ncbi:hypothetical protein H4R34_005041 [Dimargaris verticillata]|uniref:Uncharacterized protein n=1 Tax=Dimargaris verticillata TaxID=2761393 RepID=A0A9W8B1D4_9FUNG|nr:hypothetical protein H4R34_005041 [Dimargaris verticillata]
MPQRPSRPSKRRKSAASPPIARDVASSDADATSWPFPDHSVQANANPAQSGTEVDVAELPSAKGSSTKHTPRAPANGLPIASAAPVVDDILVSTFLESAVSARAVGLPRTWADTVTTADPNSTAYLTLEPTSSAELSDEMDSLDFELFGGAVPEDDEPHRAPTAVPLAIKTVRYRPRGDTRSQSRSSTSNTQLHLPQGSPPSTKLLAVPDHPLATGTTTDVGTLTDIRPITKYPSNDRIQRSLQSELVSEEAMLKQVEQGILSRLLQLDIEEMLLKTMAGQQHIYATSPSSEVASTDVCPMSSEDRLTRMVEERLEANEVPRSPANESKALSRSSLVQHIATQLEGVDWKEDAHLLRQLESSSDLGFSSDDVASPSDDADADTDIDEDEARRALGLLLDIIEDK